jgi:hypothetical protein
MEKGGVFVGFLHPNEYSASFGASLMFLIQYEGEHGNGRLRKWGGMRAPAYEIPKARNDLAEQFLATDCEWFFSLDADMGFGPDVLDQLMTVATTQELPIVGGLCFAWKEIGVDLMNGPRAEPLPTIYTYLPGPDGTDHDFRGRTHYPVNELVRSAATGMACVLIHRSVFEKIQAKHGNTWFDRLPGPNGTRGEDISFCMRAGSEGFPVFVHTGVRTNHHKNIWVSEIDFWESFHAPPASQSVDVIVPTVKPRVGNIPDLAISLRATTGLARLFLVCDDEDHANQLAEWGTTIIQPGSFAVKINEAYRRTGEDNPAPWFQVIGDDCRFHPGWLDHQQHVARLYGAQVIGSNDLANPRVIRGEHATHWMISRGYIDEQGASWDGPGIVAHEGYRHWFVDDEIVSVARQRGVFQMALGAKIEHLHPIAGKGEMDEVYEQNDKHARKDGLLFRRRVMANT